jgi:hypothetical protein
MPNWVTNHIYAEDHVLDALISNDEVDFNSIIPMPDDVYRGNLGVQEEKKYPGQQNWYGWSLANWGTKWNASDTARESNCVKFNTAWSFPEPIFRKLVEMFPDDEIVFAWADENLGSNVGYAIHNPGDEEFEFIMADEHFHARLAHGFANVVTGWGGLMGYAEEDLEEHKTIMLESDAEEGTPEYDKLREDLEKYLEAYEETKTLVAAVEEEIDLYDEEVDVRSMIEFFEAKRTHTQSS